MLLFGLPALNRECVVYLYYIPAHGRLSKDMVEKPELYSYYEALGFAMYAPPRPFKYFFAPGKNPLDSDRHQAYNSAVGVL